ncbi:hypothetical protein TRFO_04913 [Tritrichomonas foetus]|uniref:Rab-GAP TBC domain-containing protein n=1 Tax=Tritrichomonas foetus TaxID=1144522 RepID=A0A1J4KEW1_9EUKA|nr:hypothetical protein TRFO_04913 [Tritrichomonas foetus]|eukprot:OHT08300.1 hypothetical protein TRFO_04913 [Tritrichomonas foetus]
MYGENSALDQAPNSLIKLSPTSEATIDINPKKIKELLSRFHCFPTENRKQLWSYILQLPHNTAAFNAFANRSQLPQARKLCSQKNCGKRTLNIVNALIHWHAPLINCDWLPPLVQKLVVGFRDDPLFCFETTITFLTNFFAEWVSEVPGPPPEVLSRIDAIFSNYDPDLRDALGTALVVWPAYRSIFAEVLYDRNWYDLMDVVVCSAPQFLEFLVVAWIVVNGPQLRIDHTTFHMTKRAVNIQLLIKTALKIESTCSPTLFATLKYKCLSSPQYPIIEANSDAVVLRTLQSDHDRLSDLQKQLLEERRQVDEAEKIKNRRKQTYDSIQQLHVAKENEERVETAKAAAALDVQMKRLRLEGKRLRQSDERQFLEAWQADWEAGIDTFAKTKTSTFTSESEENMIDNDAIRFQAMTNLRQADLLAREARKNSVTLTRHARGELDAQIHKRQLHDEVNRLANNPVLLANVSSIKPVSKPKEE